MNTSVDSNDAVKDGNVGLVVVAGIVVFLFAWFVPSIGLLLGLAILAAIAIGGVVMALTFFIAGIETFFAGTNRQPKPQTVQIKRRPIGV